MAIVTQKISINLTQSKLPALIMHTDEQGRRFLFELVDENGDVITLTDDYSARYSQKKPDGNFVTESLEISEDGKQITLNQSTQMTTVPGISYYDISIYNGSDIIYTGQGRVVVDDHILDNETIISIAEADGLVFPDDFYTKDDPVAQIDDDVTSLSKAWSSSKISGEIGDAITTAEGYTDTAIGAIIDDNDQDIDTTWSSDKIASEIAGATPTISDDLILDQEQLYGKWLNSTTPLYRKVVEISGVKNVGYENIIYTLPSNCHIMKIDGCIYNDYWEGMGFPINFTYAYNGGTYAFSTWTANPEANSVLFRNYWNSAVSKIYLILYYTKS